MSIFASILRSKIVYPWIIKVDSKVNNYRTKTDLLERESESKIFQHFLNGNYTWGSKDFGPLAQEMAGIKVFFLTDLNLGPEFLKWPKISDLSNLTDSEVAESTFYIYFTSDSKALPNIRRIISCGGTYVPHLNPSKTDYRFTEEVVLETLKEVKARNDFSPLENSNIYFHENLCEALFITREISGDYVEIGVFQGHSLLTATRMIEKMIARHMMVPRGIFGLDTYHGFDYKESEKTSDIIWQGTHIVNEPENQKEIIKNKIKPANREFKLLTNNIITDPLPEEIKQIAVAVVDVDLFEATESALEKIHKKMSVGGIIVCEDAASTPQLYGSYVAMENFLNSENGKNYIKIFKKGSYFLLRTH